MRQSIFDRIRHRYWKIVPYHWRPSQIWYRIRCFCWHRYTTIKSRHLPHTWGDRTEILPYTMFEILERFLEDECSPGNVDWYHGGGHKIMVDGVEVNVMDEMLELRRWWNEDYLKNYPEQEDKLLDVMAENRPDREFHPIDFDGNDVAEEDAEMYRWDMKWNEPSKQKAYMEAAHQCNDLEEDMEEELTSRMSRLCRLRRYMWT